MPKSKLINEINNIKQEPKNVSKNATTTKKETKISTVSAKKASTTAKATHHQKKYLLKLQKRQQ